MSVSGPSVDLAPQDDSGGADVDDEEGPEPAGPLGPEAFQTTADPSTFQNTYLAFADDWAIAEPTPSPAPYPLQVIPRVAYTINFNMIWDPATEKWVPDEGNSSSSPFTLIASGSWTATDPDGATIPLGIERTEVNGRVFLPAVGVDDDTPGGFGNVYEAEALSQAGADVGYGIIHVEAASSEVVLRITNDTGSTRTGWYAVWTFDVTA